MNPETKFTNKVRTAWEKAYPDIKIFKHSDRFNGGIADLHFIMPGAKTAWVEVKWVEKVSKRRLAGLTDLQSEFLKDHAEKNVPSFVLIGTSQGWASYRIEDFDWSVYAKDLVDNKYLHELVDEVIHGGGNHFHG
jgi:hypothetical protein